MLKPDSSNTGMEPESADNSVSDHSDHTGLDIPHRARTHACVWNIRVEAGSLEFILMCDWFFWLHPNEQFVTWDTIEGRGGNVFELNRDPYLLLIESYLRSASSGGRHLYCVTYPYRS